MATWFDADVLTVADTFRFPEKITWDFCILIQSEGHYSRPWDGWSQAINR
jgi:hypothetical protein